MVTMRERHSEEARTPWSHEVTRVPSHMTLFGSTDFTCLFKYKVSLDWTHELILSKTCS